MNVEFVGRIRRASGACSRGRQSLCVRMTQAEACGYLPHAAPAIRGSNP